MKYDEYNSVDNLFGRLINCFYRTKTGEKRIGVIGGLGLFFLTIAMPIIGIPVVIWALYWRANGPGGSNEVEAREQEKANLAKSEPPPNQLS